MNTTLALTPEIAERVANLRVRVRGAVEGLRSGIHRSPHRGASVVFAEHRDYRPGDDTRTLDWRAYARNDRFTIKHFEQETHLRAQLVLDLSPSMAYGHGDASDKADYAAALLGALSLVLLRQGDAVGAHLIADGVFESVPPRSRNDHLESLLQLFATVPRNSGGTALRKALLEVGERVGKRGLVVIASDLLDADAAALEPLSMLRARGHQVWVFHVLHRDELALPFSESARFIDPEGPGQLDADPLALATDYRKQMENFVDARRARCVAAGCRYVLCPTDQPVQHVLSAALERQGGATWA